MSTTTLYVANNNGIELTSDRYLGLIRKTNEHSLPQHLWVRSIRQIPYKKDIESTTEQAHKGSKTILKSVPTNIEEFKRTPDGQMIRRKDNSRDKMSSIKALMA